MPQLYQATIRDTQNKSGIEQITTRDGIRCECLYKISRKRCNYDIEISRKRCNMVIVDGEEYVKTKN